MKNYTTDFDLAAAFKELDEIEVPKTQGIRANKPALTEIFSRKSKFDSLFEEYYDISNGSGMEEAKEARDAEIAKAKLARIEKIVDLDAESPEELLTSYVGKYIMQCPQCMTLFYKNKEDIEESEEDPATVNVSEVCQHCGNDSGYTLIGKVGEATEEVDAMEDTDAETEETDLIDLDNIEGEDLTPTEEDTDEENDDASDLSPIESDEFDLETIELEDEEQEDKKEESFTHHGEPLTEGTLDISASDFSSLIKSPEFKNPISDTEVRAMLDMSEEVDEESDDESREDLTEAGLKTLGKAIGKKFGQAVKNVKDKISNAIDKFADSAQTREEKADFILNNALEDSVKEVMIDAEGKLMPEDKDRKFLTFVVMCFGANYSNGRPITQAPSFNNKDLVMSEEPQVKATYKEADDLAKGWSSSQNKGPAFIYLAKNKEDDKAVFLCEYFRGELAHDQLEKYFQVVKKDLEAKKLISSSGGITNDSEAELKTQEIEASKIEAGMQIKFGDQALEVTEVGQSGFGKGMLAIKAKTADGSVDVLNIGATAMVSQILTASANESFNKDIYCLSAIMETLSDVDEKALEKRITESLISSYKNVAGFKLTGCDYTNKQLSITGKILFESGNTRNTTYSFSEASSADGKVTFTGLNEKLGLDKQVTLIGSFTKDNSSLITESFSCNKKQ